MRKTMQLIGLLLNLASIIAIAFGSEPEVLTLSPSEETLVRYTNESLIVQCLGLTADVKLQWRSPKGEIIKDHRGRIHVEQSQIKQSPEQLLLVITHISLGDKGNWTCEDANTGDMKTSKTLNLIVYQKITFTENTTILAVKEGKTATIFCEVKGEPQPSVTWKFKDQPITIDPTSTKFRVLADGLLINKVTQNDTGEYTCSAYQVNTIASDVQERTVLLKIEHKPFWTRKPESQEVKYAFINGTNEINCEAVAEPPANFTWYRQNQRIHNNKYYSITVDDTISTLLIRALDKSVFASYKCRAQNSHGRIEREIKLEQGEKPAPPTQLQLRGFNSNTFDVDLGTINTTNVHHHMDINGFRIEYMTEYEFKADAGKWTNAKRKDFQFEDGATFLIGNLEPHTTYFMRAASRNAAGLSDWTKVEKFTTLSDQPPSAAAIMEPVTRTQVFCIVFTVSALSKVLSFGFHDVGYVRKLEKFIGSNF